MRCVIDTNILVSGLINSSGKPVRILLLVNEGLISPVYDFRIIKEYKEVLKRPKFGFPLELVDFLIENLFAYGESVVALPLDKEFEDPFDKAFYEVSISAKVDFLITGNKKHFPEEKWIVTPDEFLKKFEKFSFI